MWTVNYKGYYIHGYCDRDQCRVMDPVGGVDVGTFKSLHAAKCAITRRSNAT